MRQQNARWLIGVLGDDAGSMATVIQLAQPDFFDPSVRRLRAGGWGRTSVRELQESRWSAAPHGAVDVYGGDLIRFTTGAASFYLAAGEDRGMPMTPLWLSAARERPALVAVIPDADGDFGVPDGPVEPDQLLPILWAAATGRVLWAATCPVRFDVLSPELRAPEAR